MWIIIIIRVVRAEIYAINAYLRAQEQQRFEEMVKSKFSSTNESQSRDEDSDSSQSHDSDDSDLPQKSASQKKLQPQPPQQALQSQQSDQRLKNTRITSPNSKQKSSSRSYGV